jgi:hypothetical protein
VTREEPAQTCSLDGGPASQGAAHAWGGGVQVGKQVGLAGVQRLVLDGAWVQGEWMTHRCDLTLGHLPTGRVMEVWS